MRRLIISMWLIITSLTFHSSAVPADWSATFGGGSPDHGRCVQPTSDGGFIIVGATEPFGAGARDAWLIKADANGARLWDKTIGETLDDCGNWVEQTSDGGYIIVGETQPNDGGIYLDYDIWLIKTDDAGNTLWSRTFGESEDDKGYSVRQTTDGGYIIAGFATDIYHRGYLIKTDADGNPLWTKNGLFMECVYSIQQTSDGGYVFVGDYDFETDLVIYKMDSSANWQWSRRFKLGRYQSGRSIQQTSDGGFVVTGGTIDYLYDVLYSDLWLLKFDYAGRLLWSNIFGGAADDWGYSVQETTDGGFIVAGYTSSYGAGSEDFWLIRTDRNGVKIWDKTFGGANQDIAYCVRQTDDYGYIIVGDTLSYGAGNDDVWLMKVDDTALSQIHLLSPADGKILGIPPTFSWTIDGGAEDVFALDFSLTPNFAKYYSTYDNLHLLMNEPIWTMPNNIFKMIPHDATVYWRVRGADLTKKPLVIIPSAEVWSFYKL